MAVTWQPSFFDVEAPSFDAGASPERRWLDDRTWVDHQPGFVHGAAELLDLLTATLPWEQRTRVVYDVQHREPRLTAEPPMPLPGVLEDARGWLGRRYGVDFDWAWCNLYRDGRDSVAWHRDRVHRTHRDPLVVTISLGQRRPFLLRRWRQGGPSVRFEVGEGDLLVMGGACQHTWEHAVPKVASAGPRLSVTLRHSAGKPR